LRIRRAAGDYFAHVSDMVTTGSGAQRKIIDIHHPLYAYFLVIHSAMPATYVSCWLLVVELEEGDAAPVASRRRHASTWRSSRDFGRCLRQISSLNDAASGTQ
jgi:hypothetical protein